MRKFISCECASRHFDHCAHQVIQLYTLLLHDLACDAMDDFDLQVKFFLESDERYHDFRIHLDALFLDLRCGFEYGTGLHFGNLGIDNA